jgi:hypothetical protein
MDLIQEIRDNLVTETEDYLWNRIREELKSKGLWDKVGEENLGEICNDALRILYFQDLEDVAEDYSHLKRTE